MYFCSVFQNNNKYNLYIWISKLFGMSNHFNKKETNLDLNKVEEPITEYSTENKVVEDSHLHPILIKLLEESVKEADEGKLIYHDEVMRRTREKFSFLK
jgi:hypothetical protein